VSFHVVSVSRRIVLFGVVNVTPSRDKVRQKKNLPFKLTSTASVSTY
jgi:hypothetical protein